MGVSELWSILDPVRQCVPLYSLAGKTLAVDLSLWVCEAQHVQGMMGKVTKPHLRNLFFRVSSLTLMGVKLVFVMEGEAPKIKAETMSKRTAMRFGDQKSKPAAAKNTSRGRFKSVLRECAEMLDCLGVPWVAAAGEAEAMCAFLDSQGVVDGCITDDGDVFLYGAQTVYRNFNMNTKDPQVDCYLMSRVEAELGLHRETLVGLAIFLGCDYIPKGVVGVGKEQTLKLIHSLNGQTLLQKFAEWSSDRPERDNSVTVKKIPHCLVCRHPGSAKSHERSGCVFCTSERFCLPQDYDSKCLCEWHLTEGTRQAASIEANIRKKTLACCEFPFTEIINEFLVMKDKLPSALHRRKPNLMLMQKFALEKMDWPKHYSSEKVLQLMTYTELMNRKHNRPTPAQVQPVRIYKPRVRNGIKCFEVIWKKPDHYVCAEGCEQQTEVRTLEEEALFSLAFPYIVQEFFRAKAAAQETKLQKKKTKVKKDEPGDDVMSDLFSQMSLQTATESEPPFLSSRVTQNPPSPLTPEIQQQLLPASLAQISPSDSALIGQLQLSSIDWDSSSFMVSPSQRPQSDRTDLRPAENGPDLTVASVCGSDADLDCPLRKRVVVKNVKSNASLDAVLQIQMTCKPDSSDPKLSDITSTADSKHPLTTPCSETQPHVADSNPTNLKPLQWLTAEHSQPTKQPLSSQNTERKPQSVCVRRGPFRDRDAENQPRSQKHKVKVTSKPLRPVQTGPAHLPRAKNPAQQSRAVSHNTPERELHTAIRHSRPLQRHHGKTEADDSDVSVDSPLPLTERLKMRFAK